MLITTTGSIGKFRIRSVLATHDISLFITIYTTSLVFLLGTYETGKLSSSCFFQNTSPRSFRFSSIFNRSNCFVNMTIFDYCVTIWFVVLCKFWRCWCIWHYTVATGVGRRLEMRLDVNPGHILEKILSMAVVNVNITGDKHGACKYCAISTYIFHLWMMTASEGFFL